MKYHCKCTTFVVHVESTVQTINLLEIMYPEFADLANRLETRLSFIQSILRICCRNTISSTPAPLTSPAVGLVAWLQYLQHLHPDSQLLNAFQHHISCTSATSIHPHNSFPSCTRVTAMALISSTIGSTPPRPCPQQRARRPRRAAAPTGGRVGPSPPTPWRADAPDATAKGPACHLRSPQTFRHDNCDLASECIV